jgi:demethylmenaquinone methyltransferase/2-methoxy-6-polyprenyl-1,4-benzoquinol methylase
MSNSDTDRQRDSLLSADDNRQMFAGIVDRYDLLNRLLSLSLDRRWRRLAVASLQPAPDQIFLDLGCGTGDMAIELARQAPGAKVHGIDPVTGMLAAGQVKVQRTGLDSLISFEVADASCLPYRHGCFDGIVCAFCVRNLENRRAAFAEMRRVLQPGAGAAILELSEPTGLAMRLLNRAYSSLWVPLLGALLSRGGAYRYLVDSIRSFPQAQVVIDEMTDAGFTTVRAQPLSGGVVTLFTGSVA